jgi:hypothetical protein
MLSDIRREPSFSEVFYLEIFCLVLFLYLLLHFIGLGPFFCVSIFGPLWGKTFLAYLERT